MSERPVGVGLVGLGNSGWHYHADAVLSRSPDFALAAVCSRSEPRARAAADRFGGTPSTDWRRVLEDPAVELVVLALPHHLHREVAVAAAQAGRHVLVEKPMATTAADADAMAAAAQRAGVLLAVHQQRRWEADFVALRALVEGGAVGEPRIVEVTRSHAGRYRSSGEDSPHTGDDVLPWAHERASGGGVSWVIGPHPVDHLLQLAGSPATHVAGRTTTAPGDDVEDHLGMDVRFASGLLGRVDVHRRPGVALPRFTVFGTRGTLVARSGTSVEVRPFDAEPSVVEGLAPPGRHGEEVYAGLHAAIRRGAPLPVTAAQGREVVALLEAALASAARGGEQVACEPGPPHAGGVSERTPAAAGPSSGAAS